MKFSPLVFFGGRNIALNLAHRATLIAVCFSCLQCAVKNETAQLDSPQANVAILSRSQEANSQSYFYFVLGELAQLNAQEEAALQHFEQATQWHRDSDFLQLKKAQQFLTMGKTNEASQILNKLSRLENEPDYHLLAARLYAIDLDFKAASRALDRAIDLFESQGAYRQVRETSLMKIALLSDAGRFQDAVSALNKFIEKSPNDEVAYYFLGKIENLRGNKDRAEFAFTKSLQLRPNFTTAARALGLQYELDGQNKKAIEVYQNALIGGSQSDELYRKLANLYLIEEDFENALIALHQILKIQPGDVHTKLRAALLHFKLDQLDAAEPLLSELLQINGIAHDRIHFYLAALHEKRQNFTEAVNLFRQIEPHSKYFIEAMIQAAYLLGQKLNASDSALQTLQSAIAIKPAHSELYIALASHHERANEIEAAVRVMTQAADFFPENEQVFFILGSFLDRMGDFESSISKMRKVLQLNPNHAHALNHIGYLFVERNMNLDEAENLLIKAVQLEPQNAYITDSLGWLYFKKGNFKKAREILEKALSLKPDEPVILEHLADTYTKLGLQKMALETYRKVVRITANGLELEHLPSQADLKAQKERVENKISLLVADTTF